jgi:hypothetical protein
MTRDYNAIMTGAVIIMIGAVTIMTVAVYIMTGAITIMTGAVTIMTEAVKIMTGAVTFESKFVSLNADTKTLRILTRGNAVHLYLGYQVYVNWEHCTSIPKFPSITTIPALLLY